MKSLAPLRIGMVVALLATLAPISRAGAVQTSGRFVIDLIQMDNTQIKFGLLAQALGATPAVKRLGKQLKLDHFELRRAAIKVARRLGVPARQGADRSERAEYGRLVRLRGVPFDREYVAYVVRRHREVLDRAAQFDSAEDPVGRLAVRYREALQNDLKAAEAVDSPSTSQSGR